ncbi:leucine carboxyl methyltransferase 1-like [Actinia tenebrosa]|uniref:Leucine carboxyl methyltransferase 1 n=1 Tax=Actinia tenebrosa TaxID=6105 RepID=A0A6P8HPD4_ACTTE|nr:leucine carboxyl methyltransferase 1-like [Actinia tenebrosa]
MNQSQDDAVISTNDDATACKRFAVHMGYWEDKYIQYFAKVGDRKTPEINRGYYARIKGIFFLLDQFLTLTDSQCQVVSFGAGFDTLFWQLKDRGCAPKVFVEVDFGNVTERKCRCIRSRRQLQEVFKTEDNLKIEEKEIHSNCYHLLAADLRDVDVIESKITSIGLDRSLPTVFITECVLVYMEPNKSATLINWAGSHFKTALFLNYEQVNMQDRFGHVMIENLKCRNCTLLGALGCPDLQSQKQRFLSNHWQSSQAYSMDEVYRYLPSQELSRIEKLEFLDEVDLLDQLLSHYCISWAFNDDKQIGLSSIGF